MIADDEEIGCLPSTDLAHPDELNMWEMLTFRIESEHQQVDEVHAPRVMFIELPYSFPIPSSMTDLRLF